MSEEQVRELRVGIKEAAEALAEVERIMRDLLRVRAAALTECYQAIGGRT